ncbi:DUF3105 domain-containing protein [Rhodococcus sp. MEB064]|uniref:DUF3105 domain-containing protein n=1 Tax=Rhodococcus sp. MEB064 TaxID=1587522 RepID=UPI0005AD19F5|nr:DUF3105 domain-containing protein [Rhodococcus sp. MEB064]KIQ15064.1 membrane protein [Rhodococcus sp. MEB064]
MPSGSDKKSGKSAKAIKAASKTGTRNKGGVPSSVGSGKRRQIPWLTIAATVVVVALIGALAWNLVPKYQDRAEAQKFAPTEQNQDPSTGIDGVVKQDYPAALHVTGAQRVAYDQSPPFGGPHDQVWANCMGTVYPDGLRAENAVHSLEHGAVWIAYNPDELSEDQIATLSAKVENQQYMLMSAYPGLDSPISLQSWGHQLKLDSVDDPRIDQFISALRLNRYAYPEVGASCSTTPETFDPDNPPPFDPSAPGADAVPMSGEGIAPDTSEITGTDQLPSGLQLPSDVQLPSGTVPTP